jgi:hypothetical protein
MNLQTRLKAVERGAARWGPQRPTTWRAVLAAFQALPDEQRIAFYAHQNKMHLLSARHQELAHRMSCQQRGVAYAHRSAPYSSPDPPPAPWFPDEGPGHAAC